MAVIGNYQWREWHEQKKRHFLSCTSTTSENILVPVMDEKCQKAMPKQIDVTRSSGGHAAVTGGQGGGQWGPRQHPEEDERGGEDGGEGVLVLMVLGGAGLVGWTSVSGATPPSCQMVSGAISVTCNFLSN